ncbi:hypothetical protein [Ruminiclostridium papyrosolvens]|uniref:Uncharacterized protein n=1 Tax=Ruminiclostridium papyrosolvens C7 TaxID=1330534 RepID=U4R738_9FIRM|nr:hypothetical protein [Ruminiclostridium papyrosolvens]EPR13901.1 hypothetical protein L323_02190 [Ruminiclostridium papyrosolvens C7]
MKNKIKVFYAIFILVCILFFLLVFSNNTFVKEFTYALIGVLLVTASIFGLLTKSMFLGRAVILPYKSDSPITKAANVLIGIVGIALIIFNLYIVFYK